MTEFCPSLISTVTLLVLDNILIPNLQIILFSVTQITACSFFEVHFQHTDRVEVALITELSIFFLLFREISQAKAFGVIFQRNDY